MADGGCRWPGCERQAPHFCRNHLWRLPRSVRAAILAGISGAIGEGEMYARTEILRERGWEYDL
jgi:hypothetical protein